MLLISYFVACIVSHFLTFSTTQDIAQSIGQILLDSLCLYKSDEELPLIMELVGLAKTSLSLIAKSNNPTSIASLLPFTKKMIEMHGHKVETSFITNEDNVYRGILGDLIMMSYEAVSLCPGPNVKNGNNGSGSPQSYVPSPDIISPMFATLSCCAKHCPKLLISLARDGQPMGEIIRSSVEASPDVLKANEVEVATSSIEFLKVLVRLRNIIDLFHSPVHCIVIDL